MKKDLEKILSTLTAEELQKEIVRKPMSDQYKEFKKMTLIETGQTKKIMIAGSGIVENYSSKFDVYYVKNNEIISPN